MHRLPIVFSVTALIVAVLGQAPIANAVREAVLPKNSVGTTQVRDGTLLRRDFRAGQLPAGPKGDRGEKGDPGAAGPPGMSGFEVVQRSTSYDSSPDKDVSVTCPEGKRLVGGGGGAWGRARIWSPTHVALTANDPVDDRTWVVKARETEPKDEEWFLEVRAFCAAIP